MSASKFDGCVFEMEHNPWDGGRLRDCLQYMLNRAQIAKAASVVPRRDADGPHAGERRRDGAMAGQAGPRHGLLRHRVPAHFDGRGGRQRGRRLPLSAAEKRDALRAGRHPRRRPDHRGALLGLGQQDYYQKADVWPLNPQGEIFCILQIEDTRGVENLDDMLKNVPGIGCILIGEGDLARSSAIRASTSTRSCWNG